MKLLFKLTLLFGILSAAHARAQDPHDDVLWYKAFFEPFDAAQTENTFTDTRRKLADAIEAVDHPQTIRLYQEMGLLHLTRTHNYDAALENFIRALTLGDSLNLQERQTFTHMGMAAVFGAVGDLNVAATQLEEALNINDRFRNEHVLAMILNRLGMVNVERGNTEAAAENFNMVLNYSELIAPSQLAETLVNQALLLDQLGKHEQALEKHKEALQLWRGIRNRKSEAETLGYIGDLYRRMGNADREYANHLAALEIRQALNDLHGMAASYNAIGAIYYRKKSFDRAIANLQLGLSNARESHDHYAMRTSAEYLAYCYKEKGDYRTALQYQTDYNSMTDLIQQEVNEQALLDKQNKYTLEKREAEIEKLKEIREQKERELREQQRIQKYLFLILTLVVVIVVLVTWMYIQKRKSNRELQVAHELVKQQNIQLQELNATKDKFFSIISHDVKGPLNSLTSFSSMLVNHFDALSKEEIQMLAQDSDKSLKNLFAMLENLLEWARSQTGNITLQPTAINLQDVLHDNKSLLEGQAGIKRITILHDPTQAVMALVDKNSVTTVVRNLLSNAIKFTPEGGLITLEATTENDWARISIRDTGVGMKKEVVDKLFRIDAKHSTKGTANEKGTGLGLILCKEFIEKNGGRIGVSSEEGKGSVFFFQLPSP